MIELECVYTMRFTRLTVRKLLVFFSISTLLIFLSFIFINAYSSRFIYNDMYNLPPDYRVGVVFGAKLNKDGSPGVYLKDRLDTALDLYFNDKIDIIILSGERLNPNFNEIDVMEKYILENGVPIDHTYLDTGGLDTYSTVYRVKNIFQFDKVVYISQNFHLSRAILLGKLAGINCLGVNADRAKYKNLSNHQFREVFANIKAMLDFSNDRKPKVLVDSKEDSIH